MSYGRIASAEGLGRIRKFGKRRYECISLGTKDRLKKIGSDGKNSGKWNAYRVLKRSGYAEDYKSYELWVNY